MDKKGKQNLIEDLSLKSFIKNLASELFHLDSKIVQTLSVLFKKPGYLTSIYFDLTEHKYVQPLKLYFIINFIFFLLIPVLNTPQFQIFNFNMKSLTGSSKTYQEIIEYGIKSSKVSKEIYEERFNAHLKYNQPAFLFVTIPFFALLLNVVNLKNKKYYLEHLIFSVHYLSFVLLFLLLIIVLFRIVKIFLNSISIAGGFLGFIIIAVITFGLFFYHFFSLKKFYKSKILVGLLKSTVLFTGFIFTIVVYVKFLFFYTVLALMFGY
ncbi:MAG: DUF3667 domain-containing protein [Ignavibacteriaceae bacterium]